MATLIQMLLRSYQRLMVRLLRTAAPLVLLLSACAAIPPTSPSQTPSALDPRGPGAAKIADLWWIMFGLGVLVYAIVMTILILAIIRRQRATRETPPDSDESKGWNWVILGGIALPAVILVIVFGSTIYTLAAISNPPDPDTLTINVIGRRWWWQVSYKNRGVDLANEIHIPVGVPVEILIESADVIHSLWIPQLHGKMDAIPTRVNKLVIQADEPGVYRGECAEYCGLQHAHMGFMVVAQPPDEFNVWLAEQQQPALEPRDESAMRGRDVFMGAGCVYCHTVRGLNDKSVDASAVDLGPDLTHVYSRLTIAGATLTTNRGNLAGWIIDAQHVKPGSLMPPIYISSQDLQDLLAYLETLT
jgi:cytochrome c oxidase subunit II